MLRIDFISKDFERNARKTYTLRHVSNIMFATGLSPAQLFERPARITYSVGHVSDIMF